MTNIIHFNNTNLLNPILSSYGPDYLSNEQINELTSCFQSWYDTSPTYKKREIRGRYWLGFLLLRFTGARLGEVLNIDDSRDIDFREAEIKLITLKRKKRFYRQVFVPPRVISEVATYLAEFPSKRGKVFKVDPSNFRKIFKEICAQTKIIPKKLAHPHVLRHTRAIEMLRAGVPVTIVQDQLGHAHLSTTAIYLKISGQEAKKIMMERKLI